MQVLAIGTQVTIDNDIPAVVRAITIYSEEWVKYLCVWWDERTRKGEWLSLDEIQVKGSSRSSVSFGMLNGR